MDQDFDREVCKAREALEKQTIGLGRVGEFLRIGDDELLFFPWSDGKNAGCELIASILFKQCRVLFSVQIVFIDDARALPFDDLTFLPRSTHAHREARDRGFLRQRDSKAPFAYAILRIVKGQVQLSEGKRLLDHRASRERHELESRAVCAGERDRSRLHELGGFSPFEDGCRLTGGIDRGASPLVASV